MCGKHLWPVGELVLTHRCPQMLPPVIAAALPRGKVAAEEQALAHLRTTHESLLLSAKMKQFSALLCDLLLGSPVPQALDAAGLTQFAEPKADDLSVVYGKFGPACYIESSLPVAVHFLAKCVLICMLLVAIPS
jgi:hypothetical protein